MMPVEKYRYKVARKLINSFIKDFKEKTGLKATVMANDLIISKENDFLKEFISLDGFEESFLKAYPIAYGANNPLSDKTRKRTVIDVRCVFCHIAREKLGFSTVALAKYLNKDHTTILHMTIRANNLLDTEDRMFSGIYYKTLENLKKLYDQSITEHSI